MTALSQALKVNIKVAYLDGRSFDRVDFVEFNHSDSESPGIDSVTLLYRYVGQGAETASPC
jgi:ubiquitin thioesterase protein OTUB1